MAQDWTRIEGMIIGHELDPSVVAGELKERSILAQLEWFPSSPQLLGLNVAIADDRVATVPAGSTEVVPGPAPADLADELAVLFDAEVRIGNASADHLPEGTPRSVRCGPRRRKPTRPLRAHPHASSRSDAPPRRRCRCWRPLRASTWATWSWLTITARSSRSCPPRRRLELR